MELLCNFIVVSISGPKFLSDPGTYSNQYILCNRGISNLIEKCIENFIWIKLTRITIWNTVEQR